MRVFAYINGEYEEISRGDKKYLSLKKKSSIEMQNVENILRENSIKGFQFSLNLELDNIIDEQRIFSTRFSNGKILIVRIKNSLLYVELNSQQFSYPLSSTKIELNVSILHNLEVVVNLNSIIFRKNYFNDIGKVTISSMFFGKFENFSGFSGLCSSLYLETFLWNDYEEITDKTEMEEVTSVKKVDSTIPYDFFEKVPHTNFYKKDKVYPEYDLDKKILSTHYRVEIDVSKEPFGYDYVINEPLSRMYYNMFEEQRPVVRVAHYSTFIRLITDVSGKEFNIYSDKNVYWNSRFVFGAQIKDGFFVQDNTEKPESEWVIEHNLNSYFVIIQCYDSEMNLIKPLEMGALNKNTVYIKFNRPVAGFAIVSIPDWIDENTEELETWVSKHDLGSSIPYITQETYRNYIVMSPESVRNISQKMIDILFLQPMMGNSYVTITDYSFGVDGTEKEYIIEHNKNYNVLYLEAYDLDGKKVIPDNIKVLDLDRVSVKFNYSFKGKIVIRFIGRLFLVDDAINSFIKDGKFHGTVKLGDELDPKWGKGDEWLGDDGLIDPEKADVKHKIYETNIRDIEETDDYYIFSFLIPYEMYLNLSIKEIGLFNVDKEMMFYCQGGEIFKIEEMEFECKLKVSKKKIIKISELLKEEY